MKHHPCVGYHEDMLMLLYYRVDIQLACTGKACRLFMTSICSDLLVPKSNHLHITKCSTVTPTIFNLQNKLPER